MAFEEKGLMRKLIEGRDYIKLGPRSDGKKFMMLRDIIYWSQRYKHYIKAPAGFKSDGASGAVDLEGSWSWLMHDVLCDNACWEDGSPLSNWQASWVLRDILSAEGYSVRKFTWFYMTFLFGGRKVKKRNGWFSSWKRSFTG